jgi:hypothetical protein
MKDEREKGDEEFGLSCPLLPSFFRPLIFLEEKQRTKQNAAFKVADGRQ